MTDIMTVKYKNLTKRDKKVDTQKIKYKSGLKWDK